MPRAAEPDPVEWVRERWAEQNLPEPERFAAAASVMRLHGVLARALDDALRPHGVSRTAYLLLVTLGLAPERARSLSYLSRHLLVHPTTVTQTVDDLERRGLARREAHPTDRRTTLAVLTADGRKLTRRATRAAAHAGFGLEGVDDGTLRSLTESLREVRRGVGDLPPDAPAG